MNSNTRYIVSTALIVALGGFLMGFDASVISGVVTFIEPEFGLSKIELGGGFADADGNLGNDGIRSAQ